MSKKHINMIKHFYRHKKANCGLPCKKKKKKMPDVETPTAQTRDGWKMKPLKNKNMSETLTCYFFPPDLFLKLSPAFAICSQFQNVLWLN